VAKDAKALTASPRPCLPSPNNAPGGRRNDGSGGGGQAEIFEKDQSVRIIELKYSPSTYHPLSFPSTPCPHPALFAPPNESICSN
jgi:hypothetical protein